LDVRPEIKGDGGFNPHTSISLLGSKTGKAERGTEKKRYERALESSVGGEKRENWGRSTLNREIEKKTQNPRIPKKW